LADFELQVDEPVAEVGVGGLYRNGFLEMNEGEFWVAVFEGVLVGVLVEVGIILVVGDGVVKGDEGFGELVGFGKSGGKEANDADVVGKELVCLAKRGEGFGGPALLAEELAEEEEIVGLSEFVASDEGFGEGGPEIVDGGIGEGPLDELFRDAEWRGGHGVADPAAGKRAGGVAACRGGGIGEG